MHPDQLDLSTENVRTLVDAQFPEWRELPLTRVSSTGTTNLLYRIGDRLVARFPARAADAAQAHDELASEVNAARELAGRTPFPTPEPIALGSPGVGYPLPWSVQTWLPGTVADDTDASCSVLFAGDLAQFINALRAIDTHGRTFSGSGRGGDLRDHDEWMSTCLDRSEHLLDVPRLRDLWSEFRALPPGGPDVMNHGDLIPGNVLVTGDRLAGVIDVGGFGPADPALDLVSAWHLLDDEPREAFRELLGCDTVEWERGKAWAFQQAMGLVWYYVESNPAMSRLGQRTLDRILRHS